MEVKEGKVVEFKFKIKLINKRERVNEMIGMKR